MSHDIMSTFFSGTDLATLKSEGNDTNHFVSLIVNNAGSYTAAITRKVSYLSKGKSTVKYNTFDNAEVTGEETDFEREEEIIEYYPLIITKESVPETPKSELELRLEAVKASVNSYINKKKNTVVATPTNNLYQNLPHINIPSIAEEQKSSPTQLELFKSTEYTADTKDKKSEESTKDKEESKVEYVDLDMSIAYGEDHIDEEITDQTVMQIITGDIFSIYKQNIDLNKWAANMDNLYNKRFGDPEQHDSFDYWVDTFTEFLENELFDENLINKGGRDYMDAIWAYDVIVKLQELPKNKYLDKFVESLERWLI